MKTSMSGLFRRPRGSDRGAVAVEFAIVAPLMLLLIMSILDFGRAYYVKQSLLTGASQAARLSVLDTSTTTSVLQATARASAAGAMSAASAGSDITVNTPIGTCTGKVSDSRTVTATIAFKWWTPMQWFTAAGESGSVSTISASASWLCINK